MKLQENENLIVQSVAENCSFSGLPIKGQLYLTDKRLIFIRSKTGEIMIDISVHDIDKVSKYKFLFFITNGFVVYLKNGMEYTIAFGYYNYNKFISVLNKNGNIEIVQKPKHRWGLTIMISLGLIYFVVKPVFEKVNDSYQEMIFMSDPVEYIKEMDDLNDDPTWCPTDVGGYPNLNGQWYFYDDNRDCKYYLNLNITDNGTIGSYELHYKFDQDANFRIMSSGNFKVVNGKDQYGDNTILGVKEDTPESAYQYNYLGHIFSINNWTPGFCLRLGPYSDVHNNMFGEQMYKTTNKNQP